MKIRTDLTFLKQPCTEVKSSERGVIQAKLLLAMKQYKNVGYAIAANQVGIQKRAFIMRISDNKFKHFINPVLVKGSDKYDHYEGCLSLPGQGMFKVKRFKTITVTDDLHGEQTLTDLAAAIWQHEVDHLDGKLICD